jgi:hypothetical protein
MISELEALKIFSLGLIFGWNLKKVTLNKRITGYEIVRVKFSRNKK